MLILGIDPGLGCTGWGVIAKAGNRLSHVANGQVRTDPARPLAERLLTLDRELADVVAREHGNIHRSGDLNAAALMRLFERCDAIRQPARFALALLACECDARGRLGLEDRDYPPRARLQAALDQASALAGERVIPPALRVPPSPPPAMQ